MSVKYHFNQSNKLDYVTSSENDELNKTQKWDSEQNGQDPSAKYRALKLYFTIATLT